MYATSTVKKFVRSIFYCRDGFVRLPWCIAMGLTLLTTVFTGGAIGINEWAKSVAQAECSGFAEQAHRETKFVQYTWGSWD